MPEPDPSPELTEARLAELFSAHAAGLRGAVRGVLGGGADLSGTVQDAFVRALDALRAGTAPRDAVAWIFVITINLAKDRRRRRARRAEPLPIDEVPEMELTSDDTAPPRALESDEALRAARDAIQRLGDAEKEVFLMRVSGGLTFEATARALAIPVGTAKTRMRSALQRLRRELVAFAPWQTPGLATGTEATRGGDDAR